jgi:hypothetical protein
MKEDTPHSEEMLPPPPILVFQVQMRKGAMKPKVNWRGLWMFVCLIAVFAVAKQVVILPDIIWIAIFDIAFQVIKSILM